MKVKEITIRHPKVCELHGSPADAAKIQSFLEHFDS